MTKKERRDFISERANECCEYCQCLEFFAPGLFTIEHIIPMSKKGNNDLDNLALACHDCNAIKYNKVTGLDPITNEVTALFNPRKEEWLNHFTWSTDSSKIVGMTPVGRTTIETLRLNRERLQRYRLNFMKVGEHPPAHTLR